MHEWLFVPKYIYLVCSRVSIIDGKLAKRGRTRVAVKYSFLLTQHLLREHFVSGIIILCFYTHMAVSAFLQDLQESVPGT